MNITTQAFTPITNYKRKQIGFFNNFINPQYLPLYNPNVNTPSPTQSSSTIATTIVKQHSTFEVATYALIGVSVVLAVIVIILLASRCRRGKTVLV